MRNFHIVFHSGLHQFTCPATAFKGSFFSACILTLVTSCLFDNSHPNRWEVIFIVALIYISLMTSHGEHLFMYLLLIQIYSVEKSIQVLYPIFKKQAIFFFNYWVLWIHNVFWILNLLSHMWFANIFFVFPRLLFHFVVFFLKICAGDFQCDIVSFIFPFVVLLLSLEKNHFQDQCQGSFPLYLLLKVLCSQVLPSAFK